MAKFACQVAFWGTLLATITSATPTPSLRGLRKRYESGVDCADDAAIDNPAGLFVINGGEELIACDEIAASAADFVTGDHYTCWMTSDTETYGTPVKCPGDSGPKKNPNGQDADPSIAEGIIQTYCDTAGDGGIPGVTFVNTAGCLLFGYFEAGSNVIAQNEAGASAVCDTITAGACTFFTDVAPELLADMNTPCVDPPSNPGLCDFAGPGK